MKDYKIRKILVPIDFSTLSLNALHHAEKLAQKTKAKITLLYVVQPFVDAYAGGDMLVAASRLEQDWISENAKRLGKIARTATKRAKITVDSKVMLGNIGRSITKTALDIKTDLIVMGTHGASGYVENMLGSKTYQVSTTSRIPVMSVNKRGTLQGYTHIVYPVREKTRAMKKFSYALAFAKIFKARIDVVGFIPVGQKERSKQLRTLCTVIKNKFATHGVDAKTAFTTENFAAATISYVYPTSLIIINQDSDFSLVDIFRKSFAKGILLKVLIPVVVVPR